MPSMQVVWQNKQRGNSMDSQADHPLLRDDKLEWHGLSFDKPARSSLMHQMPTSTEWNGQSWWTRVSRLLVLQEALPCRLHCGFESGQLQNLSRLPSRERPEGHEGKGRRLSHL